MKKIKYLTLLLASLLASCNSKQVEEQQKLYDEVMAIHDEIMPKMSVILNLESQLREQINTLDPEITEEQKKIAAIEKQIDVLKEADETMMVWMRHFEVNQENWPHDSVMNYLGREKEKISKVREQLMMAIDEARKLVE